MNYPSAHSVSVYICLTKERVKWKEVGAKGIQPQGTSVKLVCIGLICFNFFVGVCGCLFLYMSCQTVNFACNRKFCKRTDQNFMLGILYVIVLICFFTLP